MRNQALLRLLGMLALGLTLRLSSLAQVAGGTISGTVTDPSGAVIPSANIEIKSESTGTSRTLVTSEKGFYSAPNLSPGNYRISVAAMGFSMSVRNVVITVGEQLVEDIALQVGSTNEHVEIKELTGQVDLASSALNNSVGGQIVRDLPLNGRDWTTLATLEPGVHTVDTQTAVSAGNARSNRGWGAQMMIAGNRPQQNNYRLDGISINDYSGGGPGSVLGATLGVDAIQEFSVVTGNASADYGKTSGGVINAITRAGTNQFHGSAYEFFRNNALDARNYFDGAHIPPFNRNQFGGSAGGPIIKNRTFFFGDYEGLRQSLSTTNPIVVPSRASRAGHLTSGNITIDPKVLPFLAIFPLPNGSENGDFGTFSLIAPSDTHEDLYTGRVDHRISDADLIHGSVLSDDSETQGPDSFNFTRIGQLSNRKAVSIEESHLFGSTLANFARLGYSRSVGRAIIGLSPVNPLAADPSLGFVPGANIGTLQITGLTNFPGGLGGQSEFDFHNNSFQAYDDLFYTHGAYSLKFGVAVERIQANQFSSGSPGFFTFGSLRNFLLNQPSVFSAGLLGKNGPIDLRQTVVGVYGQDDWRIRSNLTLNLGLRYEMATVPTEVADRLSALHSLTDAAPTLGSPFFNNPTLKDFSPRIGFAWDPFRDGKTAVRGAFGIYDTLPLTYQFELNTVGTNPFFQAGSVAVLPQGSFPTGAFALLTSNTLKNAYIQQDPGRPYVMQWNLNVQRQMPLDLVVQVGYTGSHGVHQPVKSNDSNIVLPTQTAQGLVWPQPKGSGKKLNPNAGIIDATVWIDSTIYDAMNIRVSQQRKGIRFGGSYTWSKTFDTSSSSVGGSNFNNSLVGPLILFPSFMRGLSDYDVRHSFTLDYLWQVGGDKPGEGIVGWATHGWQLGGIYRISSGLPFTPTIGGDALGMLNQNAFDYPDRLDTPGCGNPVNPGNPTHYIKTECFVAPNPTTRLGNSGRNTAVGPGVEDLDVSLIKNSHIGRISERFNLQFRTELFNVLNHTNFGTPNRTVSQVFDANFRPLPNAGLLNGTSTTSRQIQFALKLTW